MSVEVCHFFLQNGYCTLGEECKLYHARTQKDVKKYNKTINNEPEDNEQDDDKKEEEQKEYADVTEICFSFDTTGSMSSYLEEVRNSLQDIVRDLFRKVPNIRISIIAHGDYCDKTHYYVIKYIDFTRDQNKLLNFVKNAGGTGGGDEPECYELALWYAAHKLKWTSNARSKALVIIGDALPHEPDYDLNIKNIDWRKETELLRMQSCTIYGVFCGHSDRNKSFYQSIAKKTNGRCLELTSIKNICKLFVALCLHTSDDNKLFEQYKNEILRSRAGDDELTKAILSLSTIQKEYKNKKIKIDSSIKRLMYDLKEIKREKLDNYISVVPESDNVFKWHVNIKCVQGVFKNVYIHLTLEFPSNYPAEPPIIKLITKIPNNIHNNITDNNICLPLFGADNHNNKSKYGSSWSAAYSIISLLINIASVFGEIDIEKRNGMKMKLKSRKRFVVKKQDVKSILTDIRNTSCICGHSHNTPYPVLGSNKLLFDIFEVNMNEKYYKYILENAIKNKKCKKLQEQIIKQERKDRIRGVLIAGNIIETIKNDMFWCIKSELGINRNYHNCVSWQFTIDMFDRKKSSALFSDYIFGFSNEKNVFFGVGLNGNIIYNNNKDYNKAAYNIANESKMIKIKQHDIFTYILNLNEDDDKLYIFINYNLISIVCLPISYAKCNIFYPMIYVKDIRLHLSLDNDPKLIEIIDNKYNKILLNKIESFNKLQSSSNGNGNEYTDIELNNKYYNDQESWNRLLEISLSCDVLLSIFTYLNYNDLIHCKEVSQFWYSILNGYNVLDRCEMRCFYTHENVNKSILGVGLNIIRSSNKWITSVETEMDLLSLSAYKNYNIYNGAWGETITHFLPLIINEKHSKKSKKCLLNRLSKICDEKIFDYKDGLMVITAIMNQFIVQLMANTIGLTNEEKEEYNKTQTTKIDPKHASEKALIGYCAFHHMLLYLCNEYPQMKSYAKKCISDFIKYPYMREKAETKDLGKFILNLAIVDEYKWEDIAEAFVGESLSRQVKWYLRKYPKLEYLDESQCSYKERIVLTLKSTMISRRLVEFQVFFLKNICKQKGYVISDLLHNYNKQWGRPNNKLKNLLIKKVNEILLEKDNINSWLKYMNKMGIKKYKTNLQICNALKKAIINSKNKEYHRPNQRKRNKRKKKMTSYYKKDYSPSIAGGISIGVNSNIQLNITDSEIIEMQGELEGHNDWITCIRVDYNNPNKIISGSRDKTIIIWDLKTKTINKKTSLTNNKITITNGKMVKKLKGHNHFISCIDISSDSNYILSSSWDGLLRLWNMKTGRCIKRFIGHKKDILSVQFSADNRKIISCGRDKNILLWNTIGVIKQQINNGHNDWISYIAFSPNIEDNDIFVTVSYDKIVKVWINNDGIYKLKYELREHKTCITSLAISPDGSLCATGDKYGTLCLWDINDGILLSKFNASNSGLQINYIIFSPNRYWVCLAIGNTIEIWDLETKGLIGVLKITQSLFQSVMNSRKITNICNCIQWSYDGKTLYAGYSDNKIRIWKLISPFDGIDGADRGN